MDVMKKKQKQCTLASVVVVVMEMLENIIP